MHGRIDETPLEPYREAVERHGAGFEATLWQSREAQFLRFEVMIDLAGAAGFDDCTILDIGCGQGDMVECLLEQGVAYRHYRGLDAMAEMIHAARQRDFPRADFEVLNVMVDLSLLRQYEPDYCCLSGTLNTMEEESARKLVQAAYGAAAQGVVFNFLSNRPDPRWSEGDLGPAKRFNTAQWIDWAMALSPRVSFTQEYLDGHDATILIRH
jgi:SAM-dependent methyltransferase